MKPIWLFAGGSALLLAVVAAVGSFASPVWTYSIASVLLISEISLLGVFALAIEPRNMAKATKYLVCLALGAMLGNAFTHLIPESFESVSHNEISALTVTLLMSAGFMVSFVIEKALNFRCHGGACNTPVEKCETGECVGADCCEKQKHADHEHDHDDHGHVHTHIHPNGHINLLAQGLHNFTDGMLIGGAFMVSLSAGIAVTIAVVSHELANKLGSFALLVNAGYSGGAAILANLGSSMAALVGTVLVLSVGAEFKELPMYLTPIGAGLILYIVATGLIPMLRLEQNAKRSLLHTCIVLVGFGAMAAARLLLGDEHAH